MPTPDPSRIIPFPTPTVLGRWLKNNHATENELWVKVYKKNSDIESVTWDDIVKEALCWGWIDGIKKSIDEHAYLQRITPRKPKSVWSKRNTKHVERLISEGRMTSSGLAHVEAAKADGRWESAYVVSEMKIPADFLAAVKEKSNLQQFFETLNKSHQNTIAHGLTSAKKPETRQKRFLKFLELLAQKQKP